MKDPVRFKSNTYSTLHMSLVKIICMMGYDTQECFDGFNLLGVKPSSSVGIPSSEYRLEQKIIYIISFPPSKILPLSLPLKHKLMINEQENLCDVYTRQLADEVGYLLLEFPFVANIRPNDKITTELFDGNDASLYKESFDVIYRPEINDSS